MRSAIIFGNNIHEIECSVNVTIMSSAWLEACRNYLTKVSKDWRVGHYCFKRSVAMWKFFLVEVPSRLIITVSRKVPWVGAHFKSSHHLTRNSTFGGSRGMGNNRACSHFVFYLRLCRVIFKTLTPSIITRRRHLHLGGTATL